MQRALSKRIGFLFILSVLVAACHLFAQHDAAPITPNEPPGGCLIIYPTVTLDPLVVGMMHYDDYEQTNDDWKQFMRYMPINAAAGLGFGFWRSFYMNTKIMYQTSAGGGFTGVGAAIDMDLYFFKRSKIRPFLHMGDGSTFLLYHGDDTGTCFMFEMGAGLSARMTPTVRLAAKLSFAYVIWDFSTTSGTWPFYDYAGYTYTYTGARAGLQVDFVGS